MSPLDTLAAMLQTLQSHGPTRTERATVEAMDWALEQINPSRPRTADRIVEIAVNTFRALRQPHCGGVQVTDEQLEERARNFVTALIVHFDVTPKED